MKDTVGQGCSAIKKNAIVWLSQRRHFGSIYDTPPKANKVHKRRHV